MLYKLEGLWTRIKQNIRQELFPNTSGEITNFNTLHERRERFLYLPLLEE